MSDNEVDNMVAEAEKFASQDAERKEEAEVNNQAESAIFQAEQLIRENKDKLPEAVQQTEERCMPEEASCSRPRRKSQR